MQDDSAGILVKPCRHCLSPMPAQARVCAVCGRKQRQIGFWAIAVGVAAAGALLIGIGAPGEIERAADRHEQALARALPYAERYEEDMTDIYEFRPARGQLAGRLPVCALARPGGRTGSGAPRRAIRVDATVVREGELGLLPAEFEELWRRAGC